MYLYTLFSRPTNFLYSYLYYVCVFCVVLSRCVVILFSRFEVLLPAGGACDDDSVAPSICFNARFGLRTFLFIARQFLDVVIETDYVCRQG